MKIPKWRIGTLMLLVVIAGLGFALVAERTRSRMLREQRKRVWHSEIGHGVEIIGSLGKPLGEMMTVQGRWVDPPWVEEAVKNGDQFLDDPADFVVDRVDGIALDRPITLSRYALEYFARRLNSEPDPLDHTQTVTWELRGFETGGYRALPELAVSEYYRAGTHPIPFKQPLSNVRGFGFYTNFVFVTARRIAP